jgi:hypothetical protein
VADTPAEAGEHVGDALADAKPDGV